MMREDVEWINVAQARIPRPLIATVMHFRAPYTARNLLVT
jgi:hypothetical protein